MATDAAFLRLRPRLYQEKPQGASALRILYQG